jgi:hypothetical protein
MKTFFAAVACTAVANFYQKHDTEKFWQWAAEHSKGYTTEQELWQRFQNFMITDAKIEALNSLNLTSVHGHNQFSDLTHDEYRKMLGAIVVDDDMEPTYLPETNTMTKDWRAEGAVTAVKDQGQCGSCWSFSSSGAMEGAHQILTGELLVLSEQQFVDCSSLNFGCNGGNQGWAFRYAQSNAIELEVDYPYKAVDQTCTSDASLGKVNATSHARVPGYSVAQMKAAIDRQPISVTVEADQMTFQSYKSGVLMTGCGTSLDHAVLAVGYGVENGNEFYLVKNSWNTTWGDQGYIKIGITGDDAGVCGIQMQNYYPTTN